MAGEQAALVTPQRRPLLAKLLLVGAVMLVAAVLLNLKDLRAIASGKRTVKSVLYGKSPKTFGTSFRFPEPLGPADAKVKVWVVCQEGNSCHRPLVALWTGVGTLEPRRLRVEFYKPKDAPKPKNGKLLEITCDAGVAINGHTKFEVGQGQGKRVIYLNGPTPGPSAQQISHGAVQQTPFPGHGWTVDDVAAVVNASIKAAYGQRGTLTGSAIQTAMQDASKRLPEASAKEAKEASRG